MKIGGGSGERWILVLPIIGLLLFSTMLLGGPGQALSLLEHTLYAALDSASVIFRR